MGVDSNEDNLGSDKEIDDNLLHNVEELIALALGEPEHNTVNFKTLQAILYIFSRQLKFLNQRVEITDITHFQKLSLEASGIDQGKVGVTVKNKDESKLKEEESEFKEKETEAQIEVEIEENNEGQDISKPVTSAVVIHQDTSVIVIAEPYKRRVITVNKKPIEVVTLEQFRALQDHVGKLEKMASPIPLPSWPENEKLKSDIIKGTVSLTDSMQALNISSRVQAAEKAVEKLVDLLTYLATNGTIPSDILDRALLIKSGTKMKGRETEEKDQELTASATKDGTAETPIADYFIKNENVTAEKMEYALRGLRKDMMQNLHNSATNTSARAKHALTTAKRTAESMEKFLILSGRVNALKKYVADHTHVLKSFTENRDMQIQAIKEQMAQLMAEVNYGIEQIAIFENDNQNVAIQELKTTMTSITASYDEVLHKEYQLFDIQDQLAEELKKLQNQVQLIRSEKADREEVRDGLRDKADLSSLSDMLTEEKHNESIADLLDKLAMCLDKFNQQDAIWRQILEDFTKTTKSKASNEDVIQMRDEILVDLQNVLEKVQRLERHLADPTALLLARKIEKGSRCGLCREPAKVDTKNVISLAGLCKVQLPAMCQKPVTREDDELIPCQRSYRMTKEEHVRTHACHRWVGGSHTTVSKNASNYNKVKELTAEGPMQSYYGVGADGKAYRMQKKMTPCEECNLNAGGDTTKSAESVAEISVDKLFDGNHECKCDQNCSD